MMIDPQAYNTINNSNINNSDDDGEHHHHQHHHHQQQQRPLSDLPLTRVKRIMKSDADVKLISQEAVVVVTKAAELLLEHLAGESYKGASRESKKMIQYKDLAQAVRSEEAFDFLEDIIPMPQKLGNTITASMGREAK